MFNLFIKFFQFLRIFQVYLRSENKEIAIISPTRTRNGILIAQNNLVAYYKKKEKHKNVSFFSLIKDKKQ
jgi:hypothetical protein